MAQKKYIYKQIIKVGENAINVLYNSIRLSKLH
jgi:hypothetical protein